MARKNLHRKPFDQGTIAKLEIFQDYAEAWIPTFVMQGRSTISIFDLFAGTGFDKQGVPGSPIRILEKIKLHISPIFQKGVRVHLYLNEYEPGKKEQQKFELLKQSCSDYLELDQDLNRAVEIHYFNEDCESLFPKLLPIMDKYPSLVYLDQNGVKFLSEKYLLALEKIKETDFLYFVSSSYIARFGDRPEFKMHLNFDWSDAKKNPHRLIHRSIIQQVKKMLPENTQVRLYPFSILKGSNIYGIIFGTKHPLAVDKFLSISWKKNVDNGEADFDIDEDAKKTQLHMWGEVKLTKMEKFKDNVRIKIINGDITNNFDLLEYCYNEGHIGSHAAEVLRKMKKSGDIDYEGISPLVTYENVYKNKKQIYYTVLKSITVN